MNKITAVVPIKMNSKRLPGKNMMEINDIPLVEWTVKTLNKVEDIDDIIVYCSDEKIKDYILSPYTFVKRDSILDYDDKNIHDIFRHLITQDDIHSTYFVLQHCTSPFIQSSTLQDMIHKVADPNLSYDSAFAVTKHQKFAWHMNKPLNFIPNDIGFTQTTEPIYIESSGPFVFREDYFMSNNSRYGRDRYMKIIPFTEGIDIDNREDFELAKLIGESKWK